MPEQGGLRPIGDSIKKIIEKIRAEREARRGNKPIRTQPKIPGLKKGGPVRPIDIPWPTPESPVPPKKDKKAQGGLKKSYRGDDPMKRRRKGPKGFGPQQPALPKQQGLPKSPGGSGKLGPQAKDSKSKGAGPYGEKPPQLKKSKKERREKYRKEVQKHGGNVIYADEWDKIDPGLKKAIGLKEGGVKKAFGGQLMGQQRPEPTAAQTLNVMKQNAGQKLGMKKGGKWSSGPKPGSLEYWQMITQTPKGKAGGGITGKSTTGELRKKYGPLKKGIRLKGKGSSFMQEYKKRVYNRAKGGSMVQGPMKRARGSGAAIKGTIFQGTF